MRMNERKIVMYACSDEALSKSKEIRLTKKRNLIVGERERVARSGSSVR